MSDRTDIVPRHVGDRVLPNWPIFHSFLRYAQRKPSPVAIRDVNAGIERTYHHLLSDILTLRKVLERQLSPSIRQDLIEDKEVFVGLLIPGGYEFVVGFFAILALGAAVVPLGAGATAEISSFLLRAQCVAVMTGTSTEQLGQSVTRSMSKKDDISIPCIPPIASFFEATLVPPRDIIISSDRMLDVNRACFVVFTSGTTGPPKGVVQRRSYLVTYVVADVAHYSITDQDTVLHVVPVHQATGVGPTLLPFLSAGACVEFRSGGFDTAWTWERWRQGGITFFSGVPTMYMRLMRHFEEEIMTRKPPEVREQYVAGVRGIRILMCGTSALPGPVQDFWSRLRGRPIQTRYGATEFGVIIKTDPDSDDAPKNSVGRPVAGVALKVSDDGQLMVKSPFMFSKYLFNEKATSDAHDAEGYFKTGDIVRREGDHYFILGRASIDIIKSGGYKLSALDIEREMLGLDYVSEVMVVGVDDDEYGQRVAALVRPKAGSGVPAVTLSKVRNDLRGRLTGYKMPTILRLTGEEIPKSPAGKVQKKILGPRFFPANYRALADVQVWTKEKRAKL